MNRELREKILDCLFKKHQAVTYAALAGVVGGDAEFVMNDLERNHRNSWVVNFDNKLPTGYSVDKIDPQLLTDSVIKNIISDSNSLRIWLSSHNIKC